MVRPDGQGLAYGIDGWKVDAPEGNLPDIVQTAAGPKTNREYGYEYYRAFYRYVAARSPDAIITARPRGHRDAPIDANPGWVGDQEPDWGPRGIEEALDSILHSAELRYAVVGRFRHRWLPTGASASTASCAVGTTRGAQPADGERRSRRARPWMLDPEVGVHYRYYAKLHHQLVPYLYGAGVDVLAARRLSVMVTVWRATTGLGEDLFVAPFVTRADRRAGGATAWLALVRLLGPRRLLAAAIGL